jgi:hypothetical protein
VDRPTEEMLRGWADGVGRRAMGLERLVIDEGARPGAREAVEASNAALGF